MSIDRPRQLSAIVLIVTLLLPLVTITNHTVAISPTPLETRSTAGQDHVPAADPSLEYVTSFGEWVTTITAEGEFMYLGLANRLVIYDVRDPAQPIRRGSVQLPEWLQDIHVVDGVAYVADGQHGLQIVDVGDPVKPVLRGSFDTPGNATDVQVGGGMAYIADGDGLLIVDVTNLDRPLLRGSSAGYRATQLQVIDNLAYVIGLDGLHIIDVSAPASPRMRSKYDSPGTSLAISAGLAYVTTERVVPYSGSQDLLLVPPGPIISRTLELIDVRDPDQPGFFTTYDSPTPTHIRVRGNVAYVADGRGFSIYDVSNPLHPSLRGRIATYDDPFEIVGDFAYLQSWPDAWSGFKIIDLRDLGNPVIRHTYEPRRIHSVAAKGELAYVITSGSFEILDLHDPINPKPRGMYSMDDQRLGEFLDIQIVDDLAYVLDYELGLFVFDIHDPNHITVRGQYKTPYDPFSSDPQRWYRADRMRVVGGRAYIVYTVMGGERPAQLHIVDLADPANPRLLGKYTTPEKTYRAEIDVVGNRAFLAEPEQGLMTIDVSDPANPVLLSTFKPQEPMVGGLAATNDLVIVNTAAAIGAPRTARLIDISDPARPRERGTLPLPFEYVHTFHVVGNRVYAGGTGDDATVGVLDISNADRPLLLASYALPHDVFDIFADGERVYAAADALGGLQVLRFRDGSRVLEGAFKAWLPYVQR